MKLFLTLMFSFGLVFASEPLSLETPTGTLYATLELPITAATGAYPVVLIHPGSGPIDRDGNSAQLPGTNDSLKLLAFGLAENAVASLRIDKRGVGESASALQSEAELSFEDYIADTVLWLELLQADKRFSKVIMLGHSEGSLIGVVAARRASADGFISVAGAGENAAELIKRQLSAQLPAALLAETETVLDALSAGETVTPLPEGISAIPGTESLFRASVQPYLISWFAYDPREELAELDVPVLIVQGDTDLQASVTDAQALREAKPNAELAIIEGMNHVFKEAPTDPEENLAAYADPNLPLAEGLLDALVKFIKALE